MTEICDHRVYAKFLMKDIHDLKAHICIDVEKDVEKDVFDKDANMVFDSDEEEEDTMLALGKEVDTDTMDYFEEYIGYTFTYHGEKWLVLSCERKVDFVKTITTRNSWNDINYEYGNIVLPNDVKPEHVLIADFQILY
jgi:hypothetical protein